MFKRESGFTLIELIVVIAVLGILAAIVIPNISSFQNKARDTQLTADVRNIQTALDMYRLDQADGVAEPLIKNADNAITVVATHTLVDGVATAIDKAEGADKFQILDTDALYPTYLRKVPSYVINSKFTEDLTVAADAKGTKEDPKLDFAVGNVVVGTMLEKTVTPGELEAPATIEYGKSTAIVKAVSVVSDTDGTPQFTVVR